MAYKILDENRDKIGNHVQSADGLGNHRSRPKFWKLWPVKQPSPPKDYSHNVRDDKVEEPEAPVAEATEPVEQNEVQNAESVEADKTDKPV